MEIGIRWRASSRVSVLSVSAGRMLAGSLMKDTPHRRDGDFFFVAAMKSDQRTCLVILCILFSRFFLPSLGMVP